MASLLADVWFYISAGGFMVSSMLFVYLLGQYRAAVESEDEPEEQPLPEAVPVLPVAASQPSPSLKSAPIQKAPPATVQVPAPAPQSDQTTSSGGISPAVVYLQNIKGQMERLDKEVISLKAMAAQQTVQGESILKALQVLAQKIEQVSESQAAAEPEATPIAPSVPEPAIISESTIVLAPSSADFKSADKPEAELEPEPKPEPSTPESPRTARKGPVWPI